MKTAPNSRSVVVVIVVALAVAAFSILSASAESSRLDVRDTAASQGRGAFDILVRPNGSRTGIEQARALVQAGYLSENSEGISQADVDTITNMPDVEVAAPIAVIGSKWSDYDYSVKVPKDAYPQPGEQNLTRLTTTYTYDNGASTVVSDPVYFIQDQRISLEDNGYMTTGGLDACEHDTSTREMVATGTAYAWCIGTDDVDYRSNYFAHFNHAPFPQMFPVIAVDPEAEARLVGLDNAVTHGQYFPKERPKPAQLTSFAHNKATVIPALVSTGYTPGVSSETVVERLPNHLIDTLYRTNSLDSIKGEQGVVIHRQEDTAQTALEDITNLADTAAESRAHLRNALLSDSVTLDYLLKPGPVTYTSISDGNSPLAVGEQKTDTRRWNGAEPPSVALRVVPPGGEDTTFRKLTPYKLDLNWMKNKTIMFSHWGTFDAAAVAATAGEAGTQLGAYAALNARAGNDRSEEILGSDTLSPSLNAAGFVARGPSLVISTEYLDVFWHPDWERLAVTDEELASVKKTGSFNEDWPAHPGIKEPIVNPEKPFNAIRIRVAGVTGADEISREKARLTAERIERKTGLVVDIMLGASPAMQQVVLPAGRYGRPEVLLDTEFTKKSVVATIVESVDKKSLFLSVLVLGVSLLFVCNIVIAMIRARRSEFAVRRALGWSAWRLARLVATEIMVLGVVAGIVGAGLASLYFLATDLSTQWWRPALAAPGALAVVLPAGLAGAWGASNAAPMEAVHRPARTGRAMSARGLVSFGWMNLRREPNRVALAASSVTVSVAAITFVVGILLSFQGAVVGSVLGDAVAVQVRGSDIAALVGIALLGTLGVGNMMWLNLRERTDEIAVLSSTGWTARRITVVMCLEGALVGAIGASAGAVAGVMLVHWFSDVTTSATALTACGAFMAAVCASTVAALVPTLFFLRRNPSALFSESLS